MDVKSIFLEDLQIAQAIIRKDETVTRNYFYKHCYPLFKSIYDNYYTDCNNCKEFIDEIYVVVLAPSRYTGKCQMENFKGVLIAATNFMDNLDQAVLRRFTFKLQFDFLDEDGKHLFFERMFETRLSPEDAAALTEVRNLTPGDFRTVRQSLYYLGGGVTNAQRIAALTKESAVKRDTKAPARIGF